MKIHRNVAQASVEAIEAVFKQGEVASRVVERVLKTQKKWGARDRAFFSDALYETVRWRRKLEFLSQSEKVWDLAGAHWTLQHHELPAWEEWLDFVPRRIHERVELLKEAPRAVRESLSDWFDERGEQSLGGAWNEEIRALNRSAPIFVRANRLKLTREQLHKHLTKQEFVVDEVEGAPDALQILNSKTIRPALFENGLFEIQDGGSQQIAPFLRPESGQVIIDACAGAGGKTLHLAALTQNEAQIWAWDVSLPKLEELARRAKRADARVAIAQIDEALLARYANSADRLLLDVPCSGSGTLRRQSDLKWRITPESLQKNVDLQREILGNYSALVAPEGLMVYATCSIFREENEAQIEWFLTQNSNFELIEQRRVSPHQTGFDGFFMALLQRKS